MSHNVCVKSCNLKKEFWRDYDFIQDSDDKNCKSMTPIRMLQYKNELLL